MALRDSRARAVADADVDGDGARQRDLQQVREPPRRRFLRHAAEVQRLLERAVGVPQPAPVAGVDAGELAAAGDRLEDLAAVRAASSAVVALDDPCDLVERSKSGSVAGGGVQALPQRRRGSRTGPIRCGSIPRPASRPAICSV